MMRVLALALLAPQDAGQDRKFDASKTRLYVFDAARGVTLRVDNDGKVEFTVPEEDRETGKKSSKTYAAESAAEFRRKHPEVARRHGLDGYLAPRGATTQDDFERWWDDLRRGQRFPPQPPDFKGPFEDDLQKWMDEQRKVFEELRRKFRAPGDSDPAPPVPPAPVPAPAGREMGIRIDTVGETLREQLSLKEGEGVVITEVKPGTPAEKAGLRAHDVILKLGGKPVTDKWEFRKDVQEALARPEFELEVVRGGRRETVKIKP